MQKIAILLFMAVLPLVSILLEAMAFPGTPWLALVGKWFVFWGVGLRLLTAGIKQVVDPSFTARLFKIADPSADKIVVELGFANIAIGTLAVLSIVFPAWVPAAAFAGFVFYALAGIQHVLNRDRSDAENAALASDLVMAAVLAVYLAWLAAQAI